MSVTLDPNLTCDRCITSSEDDARNIGKYKLYLPTLVSIRHSHCCIIVALILQLISFNVSPVLSVISLPDLSNVIKQPAGEYRKYHFASAALIKRPSLCDKLRGLTRRQVEQCKREPELIESIGHGIQLALLECRHAFQLAPWNCSDLSERDVFRRTRQGGTREIAFLQAVTSAGIAHAVTKACSSGTDLTACGCDRSNHQTSSSNTEPASEFQWSGCSDNVAYGIAFSKKLLNRRGGAASGGTKSAASDLKVGGGNTQTGSERRVDPHKLKMLINMHNNEAGRKSVLSGTKSNCKCHGVSGSCSLVTCWQQLGPFREVGDYLKDKYEKATKVEAVRRGKIQIRRATQLGSERTSAGSGGRPSPDDLIYLEESPDHCEDPFITKGWKCNMSDTNSNQPLNSCEKLCCGRGHVTQQIIVDERCHCKFHWCCHVVCDTCTVSRHVHTCN